MFITWRLHGSLPTHLQPQKSASEGERFRSIDRQLDTGSTGPLWLKQPEIAQCVIDALLEAENFGRYDLCAWVIMANHVHVLIKPKQPLAQITKAVKTTSARQANLILGRTGAPFWQAESIDHWIRNAWEFRRITRYIDWNPVAADLVQQPEDYAWSSAWAGRRPALPVPVAIP